jgi:hypothetical protein
MLMMLLTTNSLLWPHCNLLLAGQSNTVTGCDIACIIVNMTCCSTIMDLGKFRHFGAVGVIGKQIKKDEHEEQCSEQACTQGCARPSFQTISTAIHSCTDQQTCRQLV